MIVVFGSTTSHATWYCDKIVYFVENDYLHKNILDHEYDQIMENLNTLYTLINENYEDEFISGPNAADQSPENRQAAMDNVVKTIIEKEKGGSTYYSDGTSCSVLMGWVKNHVPIPIIAKEIIWEPVKPNKYFVFNLNNSIRNLSDPARIK